MDFVDLLDSPYVWSRGATEVRRRRPHLVLAAQPHCGTDAGYLYANVVRGVHLVRATWCTEGELNWEEKGVSGGVEMFADQRALFPKTPKCGKDKSRWQIAEQLWITHGIWFLSVDQLNKLSMVCCLSCAGFLVDHHEGRAPHCLSGCSASVGKNAGEDGGNFQTEQRRKTQDCSLGQKRRIERQLEQNERVRTRNSVLRKTFRNKAERPDQKYQEWRWGGGGLDACYLTMFNAVINNNFVFLWNAANWKEKGKQWSNCMQICCCCVILRHTHKTENAWKFAWPFWPATN